VLVYLLLALSSFIATLIVVSRYDQAPVLSATVVDRDPSNFTLPVEFTAPDGERCHVAIKRFPEAPTGPVGVTIGVRSVAPYCSTVRFDDDPDIARAALIAPATLLVIGLAGSLLTVRLWRRRQPVAAGDIVVGPHPTFIARSPLVYLLLASGPLASLSLVLFWWRMPGFPLFAFFLSLPVLGLLCYWAYGRLTLQLELVGPTLRWWGFVRQGERAAVDVWDIDVTYSFFLRQRVAGFNFRDGSSLIVPLGSGLPEFIRAVQATSPRLRMPNL
jgi:hypothetical protein